jgi:integrase
MPGYFAGRPPRNKGRRYPADPPRVEEIVAVMRSAGEGIGAARVRGLIVVLWRAGLRVGEALALVESDLDLGRGSILVRHGKGRQASRGRDGRVGLAPTRLLDRAAPRVSGRAAVLRRCWTDGGRTMVEQFRALRVPPPRTAGRGSPSVRAAPAVPRTRG